MNNNINDASTIKNNQVTIHYILYFKKHFLLLEKSLTNSITICSVHEYDLSMIIEVLYQDS